MQQLELHSVPNARSLDGPDGHQAELPRDNWSEAQGAWSGAPQIFSTMVYHMLHDRREGKNVAARRNLRAQRRAVQADGALDWCGGHHLNLHHVLPVKHAVRVLQEPRDIHGI